MFKKVKVLSFQSGKWFLLILLNDFMKKTSVEDCGDGELYKDKTSQIEETCLQT